MRSSQRYIAQVIAIRMGDYYELRDALRKLAESQVEPDKADVDELDAMLDLNQEEE